MKTVLLLGSFAPSLVRFRGAFISEMVARGHRVIAAAPALDDESAQQLRELGAHPQEVPMSNSSLSPASLFRSFVAVRQLMLQRKVDVLLAYTIKPVIVGALAGRSAGVGRIVALITGAGYAFTRGLELRRLISRLAASLLYRLALSRSDVVVFQNPDDRALFQRLRLVRVGQETRIVAGSGIDLAHFSPAPVPPGPSFLMIARLLKDKGIREFAGAAKRLKSSHPDIPISLVGYLDPSPNSLKQAELDELLRCGIDFKGQLKDVRPAIAACSVYVLPSYREGTPRSVLEAMAMGRAIITTDAPGCRETIHDGENGIRVPPRDTDALYAAMLRFVDDPTLAAVMGPRSRRIAEERYGVQAVNADLLDSAGL